MKNALLFVLLLALPVLSQVPKGAEDNAALRYWNAFAQMTDLQLNDAQSKELQSMANGAAPWNEATFGELLDENAGAVETMVRGTALPYCVWGIDYKLAANAPIPQVGRGLALARLNVLTAERLAIKGKGREATDHLIAGLRFAGDLSAGMSLVGAEIDAAALTADFNIALSLAHNGKLKAADKARYIAAVRALPADGLDWSHAIRLEGQSIHADLEQLRASKDPAKTLEAWGIANYVKTDPGVSEADIQQLDEVMAEAARVFRHSPSTNAEAVGRLQDRASKLRPVCAALVPSLAIPNERRKQLEALRQQVLSAM